MEDYRYEMKLDSEDVFYQDNRKQGGRDELGNCTSSIVEGYVDKQLFYLQFLNILRMIHSLHNLHFQHILHTLHVLHKSHTFFNHQRGCELRSVHVIQH